MFQARGAIAMVPRGVLAALKLGQKFAARTRIAVEGDEEPAVCGQRHPAAVEAERSGITGRHPARPATLGQLTFERESGGLFGGVGHQSRAQHRDPGDQRQTAKR